MFRFSASVCVFQYWLYFFLSRFLFVCHKTAFGNVFNREFSIVIVIGIWMVGLCSTMPNLFVEKNSFVYDRLLHICVYNRNHLQIVSILGIVIMVIVCCSIFCLLYKVCLFCFWSNVQDTSVLFSVRSIRYVCAFFSSLYKVRRCFRSTVQGTSMLFWSTVQGPSKPFLVYGFWSVLIYLFILLFDVYLFFPFILMYDACLHWFLSIMKVLWLYSFQSVCGEISKIIDTRSCN